MAGKADDGGLRSYASMTYAGLKSMIYAGLDRDDPRVKAALDYITPALHARREPRAWDSRASITTTTPSPRRWPCSASRP